MKMWALAVAPAVALITCGGGGSSTGGDDRCTDMTDCSQCTTRSACEACYATVYQAGVQTYNDLTNCLACTACYTVCEGMTTAPFCTGAPTTKDACDKGTVGDGCQACIQCAGGATCMNELAACEASADCTTLRAMKCPQ